MQKHNKKIMIFINQLYNHIYIQIYWEKNIKFHIVLNLYQSNSNKKLRTAPKE